MGGARPRWVKQDRGGWSKTEVGGSDGHLGGRAGFKKLLSRTLALCRCSVPMSSDPEQQYENVLQPPLKGFGLCCPFHDRAFVEELLLLTRFVCWSEWRRE